MFNTTNIGPVTSYKQGYNPYKRPYTWVYLGLFHPYISELLSLDFFQREKLGTLGRVPERLYQQNTPFYMVYILVVYIGLFSGNLLGSTCEETVPSQVYPKFPRTPGTVRAASPLREPRLPARQRWRPHQRCRPMRTAAGPGWFGLWRSSRGKFVCEV